MFYTKQPIFLKTNSNNSDLNVQVIFERMQRLYEVFSINFIFPIIFIIFLAVCFIFFINKNKKQNHHISDYHIFSIVSLALIYLYFVLKDPWEHTPLNSRIIFPFLFQIPFWFLIFYREIIRFPKKYKIIFILLLVFGLGTLVNRRPHIENLFMK